MSWFSKKFAAVSFAIALFLPTTVLAQIWFEPGYLRMTGILVHDDGLEITLEGGRGCDRIFRLYTREANYEVKASALLSAYYANHEVSVNYSGNLADCTTQLHRFKVRR